MFSAQSNLNDKSSHLYCFSNNVNRIEHCLKLVTFCEPTESKSIFFMVREYQLRVLPGAGSTSNRLVGPVRFWNCTNGYRNSASKNWIWDILFLSLNILPYVTTDSIHNVRMLSMHRMVETVFVYHQFIRNYHLIEYWTRTEKLSFCHHSWMWLGFIACKRNDFLTLLSFI